MSRKYFVITALMLGLCGHIGLLPAQAQTNPPDATGGTAGNPAFQIGRAPQWVAPAPRTATGELPPASMHNELLDEQVRIEGESATTYTHVTRVVDQTDGLGIASEIQVPFNPAYEALNFHNVEIWRKGKRIDKLDRSKIKLLQRETNLEQQLYDGSMTALLVLDDLRVGDRIEIAYSIKGLNPVFKGKYAHTMWMASGRGPTRLVRFRLLAPQERAIQYHAGPDVTVQQSARNGMRDTEFLRVAVPQLHGDRYTPDSSFFDEQVNLNEFADWRAIARWGAELYADALDKPAPLVKDTVHSFGNLDGKTPIEKVEMALNFVQNQIRYFGTEIGENSHRPSPPDTVIRQRFGDCKDKVLLLMALLKEMGIQAEPVLVSTHFRNDIDAAFPSPLYFNHVIARVTVVG